MSVSVLSAVPRQLSDYTEKLAWLESVVQDNQVDLVITPQEFFGGAVMMPHQKWFRRDGLLPVLSDISRTNSTGMVVGVCEELVDKNVESLWFIDHKGSLVGTVEKFALPKYDHVTTNGFGRLSPEMEMEKRFRTFNVCGLELAGVFCWEVYSTLLWAGISLAKPDLICNCIKFGPNSWPKVRKDPSTGEMCVVDFGYGTWKEEGGWIDRLKIASLWETRCPITSSTNSWNLRPISMPICGTWTGLDGQGPQSLWHPTKEDKLKKVPEKIVIDEIDRDKVRGVRKSKWAYKDAVGEFPPMSLMRFTMLLKMSRVEDRIISGKERVKKAQGGGFGLC